MKTYEEQQTLVSQLNVMDDLFFQKMVEDMDVCEEMLRILLTMPALKMSQTQPQRFIRNVDAHSVVLDLLCEDENGNIITVEVQKTDNDDHQKRMRYNLANIDTTFAEKGIKYADLPDIYAIFISPFDLFKANCTAYHVNRCLLETGDIVNNGIHELYVNAAVNDGSDIAELMQYFMNSNGYHPKFEKLSKRVQYFKEQQEGVSSMSSVIEDYAKEYAKEENIKMATNAAVFMLKKGIAPKEIAEILPSLSLDFIRQLQQQLKQA